MSEREYLKTRGPEIAFHCQGAYLNHLVANRVKLNHDLTQKIASGDVIVCDHDGHRKSDKKSSKKGDK